MTRNDRGDARLTPHADVTLDIWGDAACWTESCLNVERYSYPAPTPSGMRGAVQSIFWKPEIDIMIRWISILKPVDYASMVTNEVTSKMGPPGRLQFADDDRTQRNTTYLRDVAYRVSIRIVPKSGSPADAAKYRSQFTRRVEQGAYFSHPYLGLREFAADFGPPDFEVQPIPISMVIEGMLFEFVRDDRGNVIRPVTFDAEIVDGTMTVPEELYSEVRS